VPLLLRFERASKRQNYLNLVAHELKRIHLKC
jgi:hypothetical protein